MTWWHRAGDLLAVVLTWLGVAARIPSKAPGPHPVSSVMHRIPGASGTLAQVFYPADGRTKQAARRAYVRSGVVAGVAHFALTPRVLLNGALGRAPHPLAESGAPLPRPAGEPKHPVVIFLHGLGGNCEIYSAVCSFIASHGYVVVALESEDGSGSFAVTEEGGVLMYRRPPTGMAYTHENVASFRRPFLETRAKEVARAVEYLRGGEAASATGVVADVLGECDVDRVFLAGHSFGGASAAFAARRLPAGTFRGVLLHDVWPFPLPDDVLDAGVPCPTLSLLSEPFLESHEAAYTQRLLANTERSAGYVVRGSIHQSFSDSPWWVGITSLAKKFELRTDEDPLPIMTDIVAASVAFLDAFAAGRSPSTVAAAVDAAGVKRLRRCHGADAVSTAGAAVDDALAVQ